MVKGDGKSLRAVQLTQVSPSEQHTSRVNSEL